MAEEAQADPHRQRSREQPDPQVGVALAVERRLATLVPHARQLPQQREVARGEAERHQHEHGDDENRSAVHAEVRTIPEHRPVEELARADGQGDGRDRDAESNGDLYHSRASRVRVPARTGRGAAWPRPFASPGSRARSPRPRRHRARVAREENRRRHRRQHEHLEVRGLAVLWREGNHREHEEQAGDPSRARSVSTAGLDREQERGERDGKHRDHPDRPQRGCLEERERRGIDVGHERRLAVGGVLVELAALFDHVRLGRDEGLVGVEDRYEERGQAQHERDREQDQEHPGEVAPRRGTGARFERDSGLGHGIHGEGAHFALRAPRMTGQTGSSSFAW